MLKAKDIMSSEIIVVNETDSVRDLATILLTHKINGAPVVNEENQLIGVVTESDLIYQNKKVHLPTAVAILDSFLFLESPSKVEKELKKISGTQVGDICSHEVVTVTPETTLDEIATLMTEKKMHTLPVLDENKELVGVIGQTDIIRTIAEKVK